jgi:aminoglycoside phosphotransferase (APT) family kinase protein
MGTPLSDFSGLLNWANLQPWMEAQSLPGAGPITHVEELAGGTQNSVFLLRRGAEKFVLRRPPRYPRANSNSTMLRESRVLKSLSGSPVPHPTWLAVCDDVSVTGVCFYLMTALEGFTPKGPLPGHYASEPSWRCAMGEQLIRAAAALSLIDPATVGLQDFGKPQNWHARQVDRWRSQLEGYRGLANYEGPDLPHVDEVGRWLSDNVPRDGRIGIIHGDLQFPNVMFSQGGPHITGLIDWELATLGDPLLDLGWVLASWHAPEDPREGTKKPLVTPWEDFMSRAELIALYGTLTGRNMSTAPWYYALACYKLGSILEGSYARARAGQADMAKGLSLHEYSIALFAKARQIITAG